MAQTEVIHSGFCSNGDIRDTHGGMVKYQIIINIIQLYHLKCQLYLLESRVFATRLIVIFYDHVLFTTTIFLNQLIRMY